MSIKAREYHACSLINEKVMDHLHLTNGETESDPSMGTGIHKATGVTSCNNPCTHGGSIIEEITHCYIVIICHWDQQTIFHRTKVKKIELMRSLVIVGIDLVSYKNPSHDCVGNDWRVTKTKQGKIGMPRQYYMGVELKYLEIHQDH